MVRTKKVLNVCSVLKNDLDIMCMCDMISHAILEIIWQRTKLPLGDNIKP